MHRPSPNEAAVYYGLAITTTALPALIAQGGAAPLAVAAAAALLGAWLHPHLRSHGDAAVGREATRLIRTIAIIAAMALGLSPLAGWALPLVVLLVALVVLAPPPLRLRLARTAAVLGLLGLPFAAVSPVPLPFGPLDAHYTTGWVPLALAAGVVGPASVPAGPRGRAPWRAAIAITSALPLLAIAYAAALEADPDLAALTLGLLTAGLATAAGLSLLQRRDAAPAVASALWLAGPGAVAAAWAIPVFAPLLLAARTFAPRPAALLLASGGVLLALRAAPELPSGVLGAAAVAFSLVAVAWWVALRAAPHAKLASS